MIVCFSSNQKLTLAQQQLQADYEKLKADEAEKSNKLQELMSVDNLDYKRSFPFTDNNPKYQSYTPVNNKWEQFIPYNNENKSVPKFNKKKQKDAINHLTKQLKLNPTSIFHMHTFHFHLIISLTLLLFTHKCPNYLIVV